MYTIVNPDYDTMFNTTANSLRRAVIIKGAWLKNQSTPAVIHDKDGYIIPSGRIKEIAINELKSNLDNLSMDDIKCLVRLI